MFDVNITEALDLQLYDFFLRRAAATWLAEENAAWVNLLVPNKVAGKVGVGKTDPDLQ